MDKLSGISWTGKTWNPVVGCSKVNSLCDNCYMFRIEEGDNRNPTLMRRTKSPTFNKPLKWKEPTVIFLASMTDIFHPFLDSFRNEIWDIIARTPHHIYQILTKRPGRIKRCLPTDWYSNPDKWKHVWLGTSIGGDLSDAIMVEKLMENTASVLFLSIEPLIGSVQGPLLNFIAAETNADKWVIVGGESGYGKVANDPDVKYKYRESDLDWFIEVVSACQHFGLPVFVKQLGKHLAREYGCESENGSEWEELPEGIRVRQFPIDTSKYICNAKF